MTSRASHEIAGAEAGARPAADSRRTRAGVAYALAAFSTWGLIVPLHFKLLAAVPALEILAQRIVWASVFALGLIALGRRLGELARTLVPSRRLALLSLSAGLVATNWLTYIWAVNAGHLVQTSLGYFINPLVNVGLGILFLGERLRPAQIAACALAAAGVTILTVSAGEMPWVALTLAVSFGFYGLVRKIVAVEPLIGFCVESLMLAPLALVFLASALAQGRAAAFQGDARLDLLLVLTGLSTAAPLIWFAAAAQRLKLSTVGLLQYLAPTGQLALGLVVYGEPFGLADLIAFGAIWAALAVYTVSALRS